jgi:hypothetical protein
VIGQDALVAGRDDGLRELLCEEAAQPADALELVDLALNRKTAASSARQRPAAASATARSTGSTSVGDGEMTRKISAVAVCCSRASASARVRSASCRSRVAYDWFNSRRFMRPCLRLQL